MTRRLLLLVPLLALLQGCHTARFVSALAWTGPDTLYVAYTEGHGMPSRVRKCSRLPDNRLACTDLEAVNALLAR